MAPSSKDKWPTIFEVEKVAESILGQQLSLYFVSTVLTQDQHKELSRDMQNISSHTLRERDKVFVSALMNHDQLKALNDIYQPRSKSWRGQYYALANAIVDSCTKFTT